MRPQDYKKRLLRLADVVEKADEYKAFDFGVWCFSPGESDIEVEFQNLIEHKCGTVACALGWACTIPALKKAGLKMSGAEPYDSIGDNYGTLAGKRIFGVTSSEAMKLFSGSEYHITGNYYTPVTGKMWAEWVRNTFIPGKDKAIKEGTSPNWGEQGFA